MSLIYFRNIPMFIYDRVSLENLHRRANCVINYTPKSTERIRLYGCVLFYLEENVFKEFFYELWSKPLFDVYRIIVIVNTSKPPLELIQNNFNIIDTAGGIIRKEDLILLELKNEVWDLPKGHIEKGESAENTAKREVLEECGIKCEIVSKYLNTYHVFLAEKEIFFKRTIWFLMKCVDDSQLKPQQEEGIMQVEWIPITELSKHRMYSSAVHLLSTYINILPLDVTKICQQNLSFE